MNSKQTQQVNFPKVCKAIAYFFPFIQYVLCTKNTNFFFFSYLCMTIYKDKNYTTQIYLILKKE